jgi:hypothetical protein
MTEIQLIILICANTANRAELISFRIDVISYLGLISDKQHTPFDVANIL